MEYQVSSIWIVFLMCARLVSEPNRLRNLLVPTQLGLQCSLIKTFLSISHSLVHDPRTTFNKFPIGAQVKKVFNGKVYAGLVLLNPWDSTERDPALPNFNETVPWWTVECSDGDRECWMKRSVLVQKISLLESMVVLLLIVVDLEVGSSKMPLLQMHTSSNTLLWR